MPNSLSVPEKPTQMKLTLWIEGEDHSAHQFVESTLHAVRDIFRHTVRQHPQLNITVQEEEVS